jgi:hypothetical protein
MTTHMNDPFTYAQRKAGGAMFNTPFSQNSNATVPTAAASGEEYYPSGDGFNFVADESPQEDTAAFIMA